MGGFTLATLLISLRRSRRRGAFLRTTLGALTFCLRAATIFVVWVIYHFWVVNPSRCFLCLYTSSFISFGCCLLLSICVFISLFVASVALALVFMPGLYPTAYRATFPAFFMRLPLVCFYCLCVFACVFYVIATMSFAGYFLVRCLMSTFPAYLRFPVRFGLVPPIL